MEAIGAEPIHAAHTLGGVVADPVLLDELLQASQRGLGCADSSFCLLTGVHAVVFEPEHSDHERQRQSLPDERHQYHREGEKEDEVAAREGPTGIGLERQCQGCGEREGTPHPRP